MLQYSIGSRIQEERKVLHETGKKEREEKIMANVYVFTADGFEEIEGLTVVDLMRRAGAQVQMVSISDGLAVKGSHGIEIKADTFFEDVDFGQADLLVLPGGMPGTLHLGEHQGLTKLLTETAAQGKRVAAICAAPSVLGGLGLLKGKRAVCYPGFEDKLTGAQVGTEEVVTEGNINTSRGLGTAIPFALELLAALEGRETARKVAQAIVYDWE